MTRAVPVPSGLADLPPGPDLGALLGRIDVSRVANDRIVEVLQAESRQLAHQQARVFAAMAEVGRCERLDGSRAVVRAAEPMYAAIHEIGPALTLTSNAAFAEHDVAEELRARVPEVQAALLAGLIDRSKARIFVEYTRELTGRQTARLIAELLPLAPRITTGQLIDRLRRRLLSLDPEALRKRYQKAVRNRTVYGYLHRDGTATVGASGLSPDEAAASCDRVWELARTIRRAGHPDPQAQIRADLFVALLDGSLQQMTNAQIVLAMLARREERGVGTAGGENDESVSAPACDRAPTPAADPGGDLASAPDPGAGRADESVPVPCAGPVGDPSAPTPVAAPAADPLPAEEPRTGIEVRVRLSTLLGLDEQPGEIPGWGAIPPQPAREAVARQFAGKWRFAIADAEGYLLLAGVTRRRPVPTAEVSQNAGGTVELQVPVELLRRLAAEPPGGWELLIADLAAQYAHRDELLALLHAYPGSRFPHAALRRHVEVRDRTCVYPGCRRPARDIQQDHTVEYQHGGATVEANLAPLCIRHHVLKSCGGWRLSQPQPGYFRWRSPLGRSYRTRGEPIVPPLPDPVPGDPEPDDESFRTVDDDRPPEFHGRAHRAARPPPRAEPPVVEPDDDPPPF